MIDRCTSLMSELLHIFKVHTFSVHFFQLGGGEKGAARHVKVNKKVLVRDRIRGILDEGGEGGAFELSVTAGMGMEYGDVPCAGSISMMGKIRGTTCIIVANDATVK